MSFAVNGFVHAIRKCLDWFPWFNHHWLVLELLYNMSLEPSFSIERFPSYAQFNIGAKIIILRINPIYNVLTIINKDKIMLSLDHARLPSEALWRLSWRSLWCSETACSYDHTCTTCLDHSCWEDTASDRSQNQLNQKSWELHTQWNCVAVPSLAYDMNSRYNVFPSSLVFHWSNTVLWVCIHVTCVCVYAWEREERRGGRREERLGCC